MIAFILAVLGSVLLIELLWIGGVLEDILRCMRWQIDFIRDPVRTKERKP